MICPFSLLDRNAASRPTRNTTESRRLLEHRQPSAQARQGGTTAAAAARTSSGAGQDGRGRAVPPTLSFETVSATTMVSREDRGVGLRSVHHIPRQCHTGKRGRRAWGSWPTLLQCRPGWASRRAVGVTQGRARTEETEARKGRRWGRRRRSSGGCFGAFVPEDRSRDSSGAGVMLGGAIEGRGGQLQGARRMGKPRQNPVPRLPDTPSPRSDQPARIHRRPSSRRSAVAAALPAIVCRPECAAVGAAGRP
jgi:hypothetical protein